MKKKKITIGQIILVILFSTMALVALIPVLLVLVASFSSQQSINIKGFSFFPTEWSLAGWGYVIGLGEQLIRSYGVSICCTAVGTFSSLLVESMFAYALSRRQFKLRGFLSFMLLFTMLFSGGQLSAYIINSQVYHLKNTWFILLKPTVATMHVIMLRSYIQSNITEAVVESAKIDGAGEFRTYIQIVMPLMPPVLASIGFMQAITEWNAWQVAYIYISDLKKMPLQLLLMRTEKLIASLDSSNLPSYALTELERGLPREPARMAFLFVVMGPVMLLYPFFQRYFIKGLTVGAVK